MKPKLTILTQNSTGSYTHSTEWKNINAHHAPKDLTDKFRNLSWQDDRNHVLDGYQAVMCVDPISKDFYLEFPDEATLLAFQLTWG